MFLVELVEFILTQQVKDLFIDVMEKLLVMVKNKNLRPLRTEGQGMPGDTMFAPGTTYGPVAICIPMGIGIKKAFNGNGGIKLEFGFRFTNTDYLDDVSGNYYDWAANGGTQDQITMSGTKLDMSGHIMEWLCSS